MNNLSALFSSDPTMDMLCFSSIVFLLIYLAGFVLFQSWSRISAPTPVIHRHIISGLSAALAAMGVGIWLHSADVATASAKEQAGALISPHELHHSDKMKSMPVQTFEDQTVVFPNRERDGR